MMFVTTDDLANSPELQKHCQHHIPITDDTVRMLLQTDSWPPAAPDASIVNDDKQKWMRASAIVKWLPVRLNKFLDYGCGEGHVVKSCNGKFAMGYDPNRQWPEGDPSLTTNFDAIKQHALYDTVLLYDVLDHLLDEDARKQTFENIRSILSPSGQVYVRCHPYTAPHGTHLYLSYNKAYAHLVLPEEELATYNQLPAWQNWDAMRAYRKLFADCGFSVQREIVARNPVDEFVVSMAKYLKDKKLFKGQDVDQVANVLGCTFVDYVLGIDYKLGPAHVLL